MTDTERCSSPEQIPHLEPLTRPNSRVDCPCLPVTLHGSTKQESKHNIGMFVTAPLKLSLVLENRGNVARDHLASERTYLAYVRTSLACAGAGVAVVQLLMLSTETQQGLGTRQFAKPLGATIILSGILMLVFGLVRFFSTQSALVQGYFPVARHFITVIAILLGTLVSVVFAVIIAETRS